MQPKFKLQYWELTCWAVPKAKDCFSVGLRTYRDTILTNYLAIERIKKAKLGWSGVENNLLVLELKTNKKDKAMNSGVWDLRMLATT